MAEELAEYYIELGIKAKYMHSDIDTLERIDIIRGLRRGDFDVPYRYKLIEGGFRHTRSITGGYIRKQTKKDFYVAAGLLFRQWEERLEI